VGVAVNNTGNQFVAAALPHYDLLAATNTCSKVQVSLSKVGLVWRDPG